jgi:hypothetical protein
MQPKLKVSADFVSLKADFVLLKAELKLIVKYSP